MNAHDSATTASVKYDFSGRVALVTGGCSGIGLGICQAFHAAGAKVVCFDVDQNASSALPEGVAFKVCDTSDRSKCEQCVAEVIAQFGRVDVLVNNAAIQPEASYRPVDELPVDVWERMVAVNLSGYTHMGSSVIPQMKRQEKGVIIIMASGQGHRTARQVPAYGPIKSANIMQAKQWGVEYARSGIRVVSVSPGAIETPLVIASLEAQGGRAALENRHPLGRIGKPEEVANAVLWLSSDHASFITATDLEIDGGLGAFGAFADPYEMQGE